MFGKATLDIPASGVIGPSHTDGLSDELAMTIGRAAAWTLSEQDGFVIVTLGSGKTKVIGQDEAHGSLIIGRLIPMKVIRRCGGFREYANNVVHGAIL